MKKQLTVLGISVLIVTGAAITAYAQQKDNKGKKEQKQDQPKGNGNGKQGKQGNGNASKNKNNGRTGNDNNQKDNQGKNNGNDKSARNNGNNNSDNGNKGNGNNANNNGSKDKSNNNNAKDGYSWNDDNFKDRKKLKDQEKVTICHKVNKNNEPGVTLRVSSNATKAHMNHGDAMGECTATANGKFSDIFLRKRTDYYNTLQNSYEQVSYSRSILDYAVQKLTNSRLQLANMQNNNVPRAELERKQATVAELEQNVSLLETLIGVTANLVINKLQK
jgi:hypothetical protein